jgi:hypothetical protein
MLTSENFSSEQIKPGTRARARQLRATDTKNAPRAKERDEYARAGAVTAW